MSGDKQQPEPGKSQCEVLGTHAGVLTEQTRDQSVKAETRWQAPVGPCEDLPFYSP